jgi:Peptidase family S41
MGGVKAGIMALITLILMLFAATLISPACAQTAPLRAWMADFEQLKTSLARNYVNFGFAITDQHLDLPAMAARTETALRSAPDEDARRAALQALVKAFGDPHANARLIRPSDGTESRFPAACDPRDAADARAAGVKFSPRQHFVALGTPPAKTFSAGLLSTTTGRRLGVMRLPSFVNRGWPDLCKVEAAKLGFSQEDPCNDVCGDRLDAAIVRQLNWRLADTVRDLERAGAAALVIDLTGNGGGGDWAEVAARIVVGPLPGARMAVLRHPVWVDELEARLKDIDAALVVARGAWRTRLLAARTGGADLMVEAGKTCDLTDQWRQMTAKLPCAPVATGNLYTTGFEATAKAGKAPSAEREAAVYTLAQYQPFETDVTRLPLIVLIDGSTYSAAEQMAARLQDYGRARLLGTKTPGAGCGHAAGGGNGFELATARLRIDLPDCARLRRDGSNERRGIRPDIPAPFTHGDTAQKRADKAAAALKDY